MLKRLAPTRRWKEMTRAPVLERVVSSHHSRRTNYLTQEGIVNAVYNVTLQAMRRSRTWLSDRSTQIASIPALPALIAQLDTAIAQATAAVGSQELFRATALEGTSSPRRMRRELWTYHMLPIVKIARVEVPTDASLSPAVRMPQSSRNDERVLAAATAMAQAVMPKKQLFIDRGLAPDFVEQLTTAATALRQVIDTRGSNRAQGTGSLTSATSALQDGRKTIHLIDNVLKVALRDGDLLQEWESAKRVPATGRGLRAAKPVSTTTPVSTEKPVSAATPAVVEKPVPGASTTPAALVTTTSAAPEVKAG